MRKLFGVFIIVLIIQPVRSQDVMPLENWVAAALKNNYDILLVRNDSTAFALDYAYANAVFLPRLNGNITKVWNNNDQKQNFSDGTNRERTGIKSANFAASVNLNWTLFDGLKMFATRERYAELVNLGELNVRNQVNNTVATVINNYFNIVQQKQRLKAIEEQMQISEERVQLAERKISVGLGSRPEMLQAKVDLNAQKASRLRQQTLIAQLKEQLNQLTGQPLTYQFDVVDTIPINLDLQYGELVNNIHRTNPSLLIAQKNIILSNLSLKERLAERWPTLSFNSAYNFSQLDNKAVVNPFTPLYSQNKGFNYGLSASIPILNGFNTQRLIRQARLDVQYQELFFNYQRTLIDVNVSNAFKDYEYQKKALLLEEENILLAKENTMIALARFRQGVSTYLELRETQISLAESYNRLITARYDTKLAETQLLQLKGDLVK